MASRPVAWLAGMVALGCSTTLVTSPPDDAGGTEGPPSDAGAVDMAARPDAAPPDAGAPDTRPDDMALDDMAPDLPPLAGVLLRVVGAAREPLVAELLVASPLGTRRVRADRVRLEDAELDAGVDVYALAEGFELAGFVAFRDETLALLPRVEGDAALVLTPSVLTDPTMLRISPPNPVIGLPLGHGAGRAGPGSGPMVETPGLEALIIGFDGAGPCGFRFEVTDIAAIERVLPLSPYSDPRFSPQPCEELELEVTPPPGFDLVGVSVLVRRRAPFALSRGGALAFATPLLSAGGTREPPVRGRTWTVPLRGLPGDLPLRDHPVAELREEMIVGGTFQVGSEVLRSEAVVDRGEALRDGVSLPPPDPTTASFRFPYRVTGLEERGRDPLRELPSGPLPIDPPFEQFAQLALGRVLLLVAPTAELPLTRALRGLAALAGTESWAPFDLVEVSAGACDDARFHPVPSCSISSGPFGVAFPARVGGVVEETGSLLVPVDLFAP